MANPTVDNQSGEKHYMKWMSNWRKWKVHAWMESRDMQISANLKGSNKPKKKGRQKWGCCKLVNYNRDEEWEAKICWHSWGTLT